MTINHKLINGSKLIFNYPDAFTTLPEYTKHAGQLVTVIRPLTNEECDEDSQPMYLVMADDGWTGHAWENELL